MKSVVEMISTCAPAIMIAGGILGVVFSRKMKSVKARSALEVEALRKENARLENKVKELEEAGHRLPVKSFIAQFSDAEAGTDRLYIGSDLAPEDIKKSLEDGYGHWPTPPKITIYDINRAEIILWGGMGDGPVEGEAVA